MIQKSFTAKVLMFCLLSVTLFGTLLPLAVTAQNGSVTVGEWSMDEIKLGDSGAITPDSTGVNHGILAGDPEPALVDGKYGKALEFNGENGVYIPIEFIVGFPPMSQPMHVSISQNLNVQKHVQISAWIYVSSLKDANYNNIITKCTHPDQACEWQNTIRILGLAIRAGTPENGEQYVEGALSGYILTDNNGFNEIVTTKAVPFNQWFNVEFRRDATGMHLYLNGKEQATNVIHGIQNPTGNILNGTEYYFGHDSFTTMDNIKITDISPANITENTFDIGPNIMVAIIAVALIFAIAWLLRRAIQLWIIRPKI